MSAVTAFKEINCGKYPEKTRSKALLDKKCCWIEMNGLHAIVRGFLFSCRCNLVIHRGTCKKGFCLKWELKISRTFSFRIILPSNYMLKVNFKSIKKTLWNLFQVNNKDTRTMSFFIVLVSLFVLWTYFTSWSRILMIAFEQVKAGWNINMIKCKI